MAISMGITEEFIAANSSLHSAEKNTEVENLEVVVLAICQLNTLVNTWLFRVKMTFNNILCNQHWIESSMSWNSNLERRTMKSINQLGQQVQEMHISWKMTEHSGNKRYKRE